MGKRDRKKNNWREDKVKEVRNSGKKMK